MGLKVGDLLELSVIDVSSDGRAVARYERYVIFFENGLLGDFVKVRVVKIKKGYIEAELLKILEYSEFRTDVHCEYFDLCGACSLLNIDYKKQLELKTNYLKNSLARIGKLSNYKMEKIVPCEQIFNYRNKSSYHILSSELEGQYKLDYKVGFYKNRSHNIFNCQKCLIQSEIANSIANSLRAFLNDPTHHPKHQTKMGNIIVKSSEKSGQVMVVLEIGQEYFIEKENLIRALQTCIKEHNLKTSKNRKYKLQSLILKNRKTELLYGKNYVEDEIGDYKFKISAQSFYQVNQYQVEKLYKTIEKYFAKSECKIILDLYCGVGTIGQFLSKYAEKVLGIELNPEAIKMAEENAEANGVENAKYFCGKAEEVFPKISQELSESSVVILDPPRAGCAKSLLEHLSALSLNTLVYTSCNPATLSRDAKILSALSWTLEEVSPVDMFPHTTHLESVALFVKK